MKISEMANEIQPSSTLRRCWVCESVDVPDKRAGDGELYGLAMGITTSLQMQSETYRQALADVPAADVTEEAMHDVMHALLLCPDHRKSFDDVCGPMLELTRKTLNSATP